MNKEEQTEQELREIHEEQIELKEEYLEYLESRKERYSKMLECMDKMHEIEIENFGFIRPNMKHQEIPEYVETLKEKKKLEYSLQRDDMANSIKNDLDPNINSVKKQIKQSKEDLKKLDKEE